MVHDYACDVDEVFEVFTGTYLLLLKVLCSSNTQ